MLNLFYHIHELKLRTFYVFFGFIFTFIISYTYNLQILSFLSTPMLKFFNSSSADFIFVNIFDILSLYVNLSFYVTIFVYIPVILYTIFDFVKAGLFCYEKSFITHFIKFFILLIFLSSFLNLYIVVPSILSFLLSFNVVSNSDFIILKMQTKIYDYIMFLCQFILSYCIVFCLFFLFLNFSIYFELISVPFIIKKRKIIILICLIIGSIFSSPDLISLFLSTLPILSLFEIGIFVFILKDIYRKFYI